jgi:hypothetical protein
VLNQAAYHNSPDHYAKGTPSPIVPKDHRAPTACRRMVSGSHSSPSRGSSHLSLTLLYTIGRQRVFSLTGWSPWIRSRFHVTGPTQVPLRCVSVFVYGTVTLCCETFQNLPLTLHNPILRSYNPGRETLPVWALPISLAATDGIDFSFSSSGYLDVSLHRVVTDIPMYSVCRSRVSWDYSLFASSPRLIADFHALHSSNAEASPIRP